MMTRKGLLGIELSDHIIRYVYLIEDKGSHRVTAAGKSLYQQDLIAPGVLSKLLGEIILQQNLLPQRIFVSVARKDTVAHEITMPRTSRRELAQIIAGEIEKIPLFSEGDFDFAFQAFSSSKNKVKVVFAALPTAFIKGLFNEITDTHVTFRDIDIAPLNLQHVVQLAAKEPQQRVTISVYDQMSYLSIMNGRQCVLLYKLALGVQAMMGSRTPGTPDRALSNWLAELKRVLKAFASDENAAAVDKVFLVWDKELVADLDLKVAQGLDVKVEAVCAQQIPGIEWACSADGENPAFLGCVSAVLCRMKKIKTILPSEHFLRNFYNKKYVLKLMMIFAIFALGLTVLANIYTHELRQIKGDLQAEQKRMDQAIRESEIKTKELFARKEKYESIRQRLLSQAAYVNYLNRVSWAQVLAMVAKEMPENLALTSFRFGETGGAEIKGDAFDMDAIANVMRRIEDSMILEKGRFDFLTEKKVKDEMKLYQFGILAKLKEPESAPQSPADGHGKEGDK